MSAPGPPEPGDAAGDPFDAARPLVAAGVLAGFAGAGILHAADVHVARTLARLAAPEQPSESVLLAAALAVRALRLGSVCVDLATVASSASVDSEEDLGLPSEAGGAGGQASLAWPSSAAWLEALASSTLVATAGPGADDGDESPEARPLRLERGQLYLDRYWHDERLVAAAILEHCVPGDDVELGELADGLERLFPRDAGPEPTPGSDLQRVGAASAVLGRFAVVSGGPGTGKTTTVARLLALMHEQALAAGRATPLVAIAAPTGKAAARLEQAVREAADPGAGGVALAPATRELLASLRGSTLHRLLGRLPGSEVRFRHDARNRLPHDVVVVDEVSMVSLSLMARLLEAVRPDARVVLVGDHEQLASVEAGSVLGDIVGPAAEGLQLSAARERLLAGLAARPAVRPPVRPGGLGSAGEAAQAGGAADAPAPPIADAVVVLRRVHRFGGAISELAGAIQRGDAAGAIEVLAGAGPELTWLRGEAAAGSEALAPARALAVEAGRSLYQAAAAGDAAQALGALGAFRLLCATRRGPYGVESWQQAVEGWTADGVAGFCSGEVWAAGHRFYAGLPLLVTENDYDLRLYNGDAGVVVAGGEGRLVAVFESAGPAVSYGLDRLGTVERCFASTVHKSQGSQFGAVAVVLPEAGSPVLTRELLYTAVTRARRRVVLAGSAEAVAAAVERPIARASGLRRRLWGSAPGDLPAP